MTLDVHRTLFIGLPSLPASKRKAEFFDNFNVNELEILVWDMQNFRNEAASAGFNLNGQLADRHSADFMARYSQKIGYLLDWAADGHAFLIFPQMISWPVVGTGSVRDTHLSALAPFQGLSFTVSHGHLVRVVTFPELFVTFVNNMTYEYTISGNGIIPIFRTATTQSHRSEIVAGIVRIGRGVIVFSPPLTLDSYLEQINRLPGLLARTPQELPPWTNRFQSDRERNSVTATANIEAEISKLRDKADGEIAITKAEQGMKTLYSGSDHYLVEKVAEALREFDLKVVDGPHPRADLLIWDGRRLAAAEVKGLTGSARENNLRQAQRWAADVNSALASTPEERETDVDLQAYAEKLRELGINMDTTPLTDVECRGLMIIGTYRDMALDERPSASFPDALARTIARSDVFALTGLDLYCLVQEARSNPDRRKEITDQLLSGSCVLAPQDWRKWISVNPDEPSTTEINAVSAQN